jgi:hypothetical protein
MRKNSARKNRNATSLRNGNFVLYIKCVLSFFIFHFKYYEMSYGLNVEMHKQTEIAKRLGAICAQLVPYLSQEVNIFLFVSQYYWLYFFLL